MYQAGAGFSLVCLTKTMDALLKPPDVLSGGIISGFLGQDHPDVCGCMAEPGQIRLRIIVGGDWLLRARTLPAVSWDGGCANGTGSKDSLGPHRAPGRRKHYLESHAAILHSI